MFASLFQKLDRELGCEGRRTEFCIIAVLMLSIVEINRLKPIGYVMHQQFNVQQLYVLHALYLCVLYLSENKQRPVPLTALTDWFL